MVERSRTYTWSAPSDVGDFGADAPGLKGMDLIRARIAGEEPMGPAADTLGYHLVDAGEGWAVIELIPREFHCNTKGTIQGGVIAAVVDSAFGAAVTTMNPDRRPISTLDLNCRYIRAIKLDSGPVEVRADIEHIGRTTATLRATVHDGGGRLVASATSTLLIHS